MNNNEYIRLSLELHLFFDRIMKEHSLFLEVAFLEKNNEYKRIAKDFKRFFSNTLNEVVTMASGNISDNFLSSEVVILMPLMN